MPDSQYKKCTIDHSVYDWVFSYSQLVQALELAAQRFSSLWVLVQDLLYFRKYPRCSLGIDVLKVTTYGRLVHYFVNQDCLPVLPV